MLLDQFFKLEHAKEEIVWLNIEIPHLITFIKDEEAFLSSMQKHFKHENPPLAHQIALCCQCFKQANSEHCQWLRKLAELPGFTGSIAAGQAKEHIGGPLKGSIQEVGETFKAPKPLDHDLSEAQVEEEKELGRDLEAVMSLLDFK